MLASWIRHDIYNTRAGSDRIMPEHKGTGRVTGVVLTVSDPKIFDFKTQKNSTMHKDYYHVIIRIKNNKRVKIYFPITANVSGLHEKGSIYSRKDFVQIKNEKNGEWIPYQMFNPTKIVGYTVEVSGDVIKQDDGNYYMNKLDEFKIHGMNN
jgi:hypothetical protein